MFFELKTAIAMAVAADAAREQVVNELIERAQFHERYQRGARTKREARQHEVCASTLYGATQAVQFARKHSTPLNNFRCITMRTE